MDLLAVAKMLAELHPEPPEDVSSLVAVGDGPGAPPGLAGRDLDGWAGRRSRPAPLDLVDVRFALHAQHPAHDVDALGVPAGVDAESRCAADSRRGRCRRRQRDALLDVGACGDLRSRVDRFGSEEPPGTGGDMRGQGIEVAEFTPGRGGVTKSADMVLRVDARRRLRYGWLARPRGALSPRRNVPPRARTPTPLGATDAMGKRGCGAVGRPRRGSRSAGTSCVTWQAPERSGAPKTGSFGTPVRSGSEVRVGCRERVADALFELRVPAVEFRAELGRAAQVRAGGDNAERAAYPRHPRGVGPVQQLAGLSDDTEHLRGCEAVNGSQSNHFRPARLSRSLRRQEASFARGALRCTHPHAVDDEAPVAGVVPQQAIYDALGIGSAPGGISQTFVSTVIRHARVVPLAVSVLHNCMMWRKIIRRVVKMGYGHSSRRQSS